MGKKVVTASQTVSLPQQLKSKAEELNITLKFTHVNRMMIRQMGNMKKVNCDVNVPMLPYERFSLYHLRGKGVVAWVTADLQQKEHKNIYFVFHGTPDANWRVQVMHRDIKATHVLFHFHISRGNIEKMRCA